MKENCTSEVYSEVRKPIVATIERKKKAELLCYFILYFICYFVSCFLVIFPRYKVKPARYSVKVLSESQTFLMEP